MKRLLKIFLTLFILSILITVCYWADSQDFFQGSYSELTEEQNNIFKWQEGDDVNKLMTRYKQHFADTEFVFPRQKVAKIKLFKNIPVIGVFSSKTLKQNNIDTVINFCNDTANFDWSETTWNSSESEYYVRLYDSNNKVIGKIYFCLADCGMTRAKPFCPLMKFGKLSSTGFDKINRLINNKDNWE